MLKGGEMLKNTMLLLTILSVSCVSLKKAPLHDLLIIMKDGEIDLDKSRCRVRCYDYAKMETVDDRQCDDGGTFNSGNYPITECNRILGPEIKFFAEDLKPYIEFSKRECEDSQNQ